jgi:hypothetical protein
VRVSEQKTEGESYRAGPCREGTLSGLGGWMMLGAGLRR